MIRPAYDSYKTSGGAKIHLGGDKPPLDLPMSIGIPPEDLKAVKLHFILLF